jgi:glycosyltransferase involved in cell wall biosynthesis
MVDRTLQRAVAVSDAPQGSPVGSGTTGNTAVAYLVAYYPTISHTFIRREVAAVRAQGVRVETFSVRRPGTDEILSGNDRREFETTGFVLDNNGRAIVATHLRALVTKPVAYVSTLKRALTAGPRQLRARVWQLFYFAEAVQLVHLMRKADVRHVHVHFANNAADIARLAAHLGTQSSPDQPWTWSLSVHGPTEFLNVHSADLAAKVEAAAFVSCISDFCRSQVMALVPAAQWPKLHVVHMGVDSGHFPPMSSTRAAREKAALRVLFVGRLVGEKGVSLLLDAVQILQERQQQIELVIVGTGPLGEQLTAEVVRRGLTDAVTLVGAVGQDELPTWYAWADVFCLPSFSEGLPVVLMEAMLSELPVVTTVIAGIPELVKHDDNGLMVPPGRPDEIAAALQRLADAPHLRAELGAAARLTVQRDFDTSENGAALARLFEMDRTS